MTHVLIVDDEPSICGAFRECLTDEAFSVDIASTAEQALVIVAQNVPDVIVMDVRLPGMHGLNATKRLPATSIAVPIIRLPDSQISLLAMIQVNYGVTFTLQRQESAGFE